jgi:hypothetical protein
MYSAEVSRIMHSIVRQQRITKDMRKIDVVKVDRYVKEHVDLW